MIEILIEKEKRLLTARSMSGAVLLQCPVVLGFSPVGHKEKEGDGKTPEGEYFVCLKREKGKFGCALGVSYPSFADAEASVLDGRLSAALLPLFSEANNAKKRPPWGTPLGGEIYIHGGGTQSDWTAGCVALRDEDMNVLFALAAEGDRILITP